MELDKIVETVIEAGYFKDGREDVLDEGLLREHITAAMKAYGDERERRLIERIVVAFAYQSNADMSATDVLKMIGEAARTSQAEDTTQV